MKYKTIFIANISEIALPLVAGMRKAAREFEIFEDHAYCDRFICSSEDHRILVTPLPLDSAFAAHMNELLRFRNVSYLSPAVTGDSVCDAIGDDRALFRKILGIIRANPGISVHSYAITPQFVRLIRQLRAAKAVFETHEMPESDAAWTAPFFDSKAGFRQAVATLGQSFPRMPRGIIVSGVEELVGWMRYYLTTSEGVVLKSNRGLAGAGLRIIRKHELPLTDIRQYVMALIRREPFWLLDPTVVEEFIPPDMSICGGAPNIELEISNGSVKTLYPCSMRIREDGMFMGTEFGRGTVPKWIERRMRRAGQSFGTLLKTVKYRGHFELDFVYADRDQRLYPIESNVRRTGGTHAYELALRLLGENFLSKYTVISMNKSDAPGFSKLSYQQIRDRFRDLIYPMGKAAEGIVFTMMNYRVKNKVGYVAIGRNIARARAVESAFQERINRS